MDRNKAGCRGGHNIVVHAVSDVSDFVGAASNLMDNSVKERG
jgi:hypothetical protein